MNYYNASEHDMGYGWLLDASGETVTVNAWNGEELQWAMMEDEI